MESHRQSDEVLIEEYLSGASENFEILVRRYEDKVFTAALYLTNNTRDAEHVLRKVFVALYHKLQTDPGKAPLFSWLIQHTLDQAISKLVKSDGASLHTGWPMLLDDTLEQHVETFQKDNTSVRFALGNAVCMLPHDLKLVFLLRDIQGLAIQETARILKINIFEVRRCLRRARARIRTELPKIMSGAAIGGNSPWPELPQHPKGNFEPIQPA